MSARNLNIDHENSIHHYPFVYSGAFSIVCIKEAGNQGSGTSGSTS
jgi:hypothetical protein